MSKTAPVFWLICVILPLLSITDLPAHPQTASSPDKAETALSHFQTAKTLQSQGKTSEAVSEFRRFLSLSGGDTAPDLLQKQAEAALFVIRHQTEAESSSLISDLSRRLNGHPRLQSQFYFRLAEHYEWAGRYDLAKLYISQAIPLLESRGPAARRSFFYFEAYLRLGRVLEKSGDLTGALQAFQKVASDRENQSLRTRLNGVFRAANLYIRLNQEAAARSLLQSVEQEVGSSSSAMIFYYRLYHFNRMYHQTAEADRCLRKCLELGSRLPELKSLPSSGSAEIMQTYRRVLLSYFFLGRLYQDRQDMPHAIQQFEKIVSASAPQGGSMRWASAASALLVLYEKVGRTKEFMDAFIKQTLLKLDRRSLCLFLYHVVEYYEHQNQPREVKVYAERLLEVSARLSVGPDPQLRRLEAVAYFRLANLLAKEGNSSQAADYYYKMLTAPAFGPPCFKAQVESAFNLVNLYHQTGRQAEVDKVFQEATRKVSEYLYSDRVRSQPFYQRQRPDLVKIAIDFYYRAAQYYDKAGQKSTAQQYLQNIIQLKGQ